MFYSSKAIKSNNENDWSFEKALAAFGKEMFKAEAVHHLEGNSNSIDAGINVAHALVNSDEQLNCLFCS